VVVLDSVITHTSTWFLDMEIHQLVVIKVCTYHIVKTLVIKKFGEKAAAKNWQKNFGEC